MAETFTIEVKKNIPQERFTKKKKTSPFMTKYEYTRLIAARAVQILSDENFDCKYDTHSATDIATEELHRREIPLVIIRKLPNGEEEVWDVKSLHIRDY